MEDVIKDIKRTKNLLDGFLGSSFLKYSDIYFSTNEVLDEIMHDFIFKDKRVLSVLASGDQAFYFFGKEASCVDVFDINKLTFYYYYLRIWAVQFMNIRYINNLSHETVLELLSMVKPKNENERKAYLYWRNFINSFSSSDYARLFINSDIIHKNHDYDLGQLKLRFLDLDFNFYNADITLKNNIKNKYDYIYTSNISEYIQHVKDLEQYRDNLYDLLNDDGVVISSNVARVHPSILEKIVMRKKFKFHSLSFLDSFNPNSFGYYYMKRR